MFTGRIQRVLAALILPLLLVPAIGHAQTGAASITGLVTDDSGSRNVCDAGSPQRRG